MASQPTQSGDMHQLHDLVEELANELCPAVDGKFGFLVKVSAHNESIDKLQMLVNLVLDSASRAIEELQETKNYTENIISSMIDMLLVIAPDGRIVTVNKATSKLLGYREDELIGQPASMLFSEEEDDTHLIVSQEALPFKRTVLRRLEKDGAISNIEKSVLAKRGDNIPVLLSGSVMRDNAGTIQGIVCVAQDITERKQAQEASERARTKAEASAQRAEQARADMERMNAVMMGREERVLEMKQEVNDLLVPLGQERKYEQV